MYKTGDKRTGKFLQYNILYCKKFPHICRSSSEYCNTAILTIWEVTHQKYTIHNRQDNKQETRKYKRYNTKRQENKQETDSSQETIHNRQETRQYTIGKRQDNTPETLHNKHETRQPPCQSSPSASVQQGTSFHFNFHQYFLSQQSFQGLLTETEIENYPRLSLFISIPDYCTY